MKRSKLFLTATAVLAIAGSALAFNSKFNPGSVYCFPTSQTVVTTEACSAQSPAAQPNVKVDLINGTTQTPCSSLAPYDGSVSGQCNPITTNKFTSTGF